MKTSCKTALRTYRPCRQMTPAFYSLMAGAFSRHRFQEGQKQKRIRNILDHRCGRFGVIYLVVWEGQRDAIWEPECRIDDHSVRTYFLSREGEGAYPIASLL